MVPMWLMAFEKIALVDSFDFPAQGRFDVETRKGTEDVLSHVLLTGADTVLWRNMSGAVPRYRSAEESAPLKEPPLDVRCIPLNEPIRGWIRWDSCETNSLEYVAGLCKERGKGFGIHFPFEENHGEMWTLGTWNLEHPQFWCAAPDRVPWPGRCSLAYPEVLAHKLRLVDEALATGADTIYLDIWRAGNWTVGKEFVSPILREWKIRYGDSLPDAKDERWLEIVSRYQHAYIRGIRKRCDMAGRKVRLFLGLPQIDAADMHMWRTYAIDWKKLAKEGFVDGLVVNSLRPDENDIWNSTRRLYEYVMEHRGNAKVYFPVAMYDYNYGVPSYCRATGMSTPIVVRQLMDIAREVGGHGVTFEVVDYGNYTPEICKETRK